MAEVVQMPEEGRVVTTMKEIAESDDFDFAYVDGFEKGTKLIIGSLTAGDLIEWSEANEDAKRTAGLRLICKSLIDAPNKTAKRYAMDASNIAVFRNKSHKDTERLIRDILKLNKMEVKGQADAAKNG